MFVRAFFVIWMAMSFAASVQAQSTTSLDDFDLGTESDVADDAAVSELEKCLSSRSNCEDDGISQGVSFSIDDVVNWGIMDRDEIAQEPAGAGGQVVTDNQSLPSVDLEILFDYRSADLRADQSRVLDQLVRLYDGPTYKDHSFLLFGHTDAKGSAAYNLKLSEQRAASVANYVRTRARSGSDRLISAGRGFEDLKNRNDPLSAENRRVQLVLVRRAR